MKKISFKYIIPIIIICITCLIMPLYTIDNTIEIHPPVAVIDEEIQEPIKNVQQNLTFLINQEIIDTNKQDMFINDKMKCELVENKSGIPYYVIYPTNTKPSSLIVWLHGSGECNVSESQFMSISFPQYLMKLDNLVPDSYIICPQLKGNLSTGRWNNDTSFAQVTDIITAFIVAHDNISQNEIILMGHSLGAQGVLYFASKNYEFNKYIAFSPYNPGNTDFIKNKDDIIIIVGDESYGEDIASIKYSQKLQDLILNNNIIKLPSNHGNLPIHTISIDNNKDGCSDLLEWALVG